jgi:hypothetical protein
MLKIIDFGATIGKIQMTLNNEQLTVFDAR